MKRATLLALAVSACLLTGCTNALKDGTGYLEDGNYKEAVTAFQKAVDEGKKTAEAYRGLGMAYYELEDYESAKDAFEKAISAGGGKNQAIYNFLGICGMKLNDYNYALEQFNQGISLSQNSGTSMEDAESFSEVLQEMLFNQIVCYEKLGDWENAKTKIAEYIQVYPDDADAQREANFGDQIKNTREEEDTLTAEKILRSASFIPGMRKESVCRDIRLPSIVIG